MKESKSDNNVAKEGGNLRNFDLSVEEIRILKAIKDIKRSIEDIERKDPNSDRLDFFRKQVSQLEEKLDEIRDNTLIR